MLKQCYELNAVTLFCIASYLHVKEADRVSIKYFSNFVLQLRKNGVRFLMR